MNNVMIDLETLGSTPGCAILSIGAVEFSLETETLGEEFYTIIELQDCLDAGLKIDADTFYWWIQQSEIARKHLLPDRKPLKAALIDFALFIKPAARLWSHGASFDLPVLSCAYKAARIARPWAFRNERDTRTIFDLANVKVLKTETAHTALEDAKNQARTMIEAFRKLKK